MTISDTRHASFKAQRTISFHELMANSGSLAACLGVGVHVFTAHRSLLPHTLATTTRMPFRIRRQTIEVRDVAKDQTPFDLLPKTTYAMYFLYDY